MRKRCASIFHSIEKVCAFGREKMSNTVLQALTDRRCEKTRIAAVMTPRSASDPFRQSVRKNGLDDSPCTNQGNTVRLRSGNARFLSHYGLCPTHRESVSRRR